MQRQPGSPGPRPDHMRPSVIIRAHKPNYKPAAPKWLSSLRGQRETRVRAEENVAMEGELVRQRVYDR